MNESYELIELKHEYARIQGDIEKLDATGNNTSQLEKRLETIETKIKHLRQSSKTL